LHRAVDPAFFKSFPSISPRLSISRRRAGRFIQALLFDTTPRDPVTVVVSVLVLIVVAASAGWIPARRAAHLDPADVLREV